MEKQQIKGSNMLTIGLMSGTSMDGVDAALLELSDEGAILADLGHATLDYTRETKLLLKAMEASVRNAKGDLTLARVDFAKNVVKTTIILTKW